MRRLSLIVLAWVALQAGAYADISPDPTALAKRATALVEIPANGQRTIGTAFCIDSGGVFLTSAHLLESPHAKIRLVLDAGRADQKILPGEVLRSDPKHDLALIYAPGAAGTPALELAANDSLPDKAELVALGYRLAQEDLNDKIRYPAVGTHTGRVTHLRAKEAGLELIQLEADLRPGSSGGPVLDSSAKAVGVVFGGVRGSRTTFAVPARDIRIFLTDPLALVSPLTIPADQKYTQREFAVRVVWLGAAGSSGPATRESPPSLDVTAIFDPGNQQRAFQAVPVVVPAPATKPAGETFTFKAAPIADREQQLELQASFGPASIKGAVEDRAVIVAGRALRLSKIRRIERKTGAVVYLVDGSTIEGADPDLTDITVWLDQTPVKVDLSRARLIVIERPREPTGVDFVIEVKDGPRTLTRAAGRIELIKEPAKR